MTKRLFDFSFSFLALLLLLPILLIIFFLVFYNLGSPVIYRQLRPGLHEKLFYLYKFRSMTNLTNAKGKLLADEKRLNRFGKFLRASSLDELPALWNVMKGDMSLVGPRPLLMEYLPLYNKNQKRRHEVKPGITGWAQVNGRNSISWKKKFDFDIWYIDHHTCWLDLKIIVLTIKRIFLQEGIAEPGEVTMSKFKGNKK
ncbi:sugar transferase [Candidatus Methylopumilus rimovensis]|uniref:Sugar transferase n=1 Tax=Candidatus Methylopumilus rimovensis TaxID=2588535 RepID=A0AAE6FSK6_9PROT|nr:sugar transferase [Candidatus Methylopumilus rimovensis]QDD13385.1 sugar transferase [Candidatus Methylopumilus rimovensis]